jgi:PEP-CTERM motif
MKISSMICSAAIVGILTFNTATALESQSWDPFGFSLIDSFIPTSLTTGNGDFNMTMSVDSAAVLSGAPRNHNSILDPTVPITNPDPFFYMYYSLLAEPALYNIVLEATGGHVIESGAMFLIGGIAPLEVYSINFFDDTDTKVNDKMIQMPMVGKTFVVTGTDTPGSVGLVYDDALGTVTAGDSPNHTGAIFLQNTSGSPIDKIEIGLGAGMELNSNFYIGYTNVPEPSTYLILGSSLGLLAFVAYKRKKSQPL